MNRDDDHLPFRHATRLVNAFQRDIGALGLTAVGRDLDGAAVLLVLIRKALGGSAITHVSMHAVAMSLKRPPETIRRAGLRMVERGFFRKLPRSTELHPRFHRNAAIVRLEKDVRDRVRRLFDDFEDAGFHLPDGIRDHDDVALTAAALDIYLSVYELTESRITHPIRLHVMGAVTILNAAALTRDPVLGGQYGYDRTVPPEELRQPATVKAIADSTGFPYATIWRQVAALRGSGALRAVPGGYLLSERFIDDEQTSRLSRTKIKYVRRILNDLARGQYASRSETQLSPG